MVDSTSVVRFLIEGRAQSKTGSVKDGLQRVLSKCVRQMLLSPGEQEVWELAVRKVRRNCLDWVVKNLSDLLRKAGLYYKGIRTWRHELQILCSHL